MVFKREHNSLARGVFTACIDTFHHPFARLFIRYAFWGGAREDAGSRRSHIYRKVHPALYKSNLFVSLVSGGQSKLITDRSSVDVQTQQEAPLDQFVDER